ncbi:SRPBCC family protein [Variovorax sp. EL159]|uniref:SRPBCC family protein n=1 Tax=Variovorax sp. EL159 TaxID=1566270 RepID=UPI000880533C|nr:SRPBCC family protein [Variovorax sp. EL159]SCX74715.1 Carbon monoxide dehydrogenase subunit G [Variovorax sp. EL159]
MLKTIALVVVAAIAALLIFAATRPDTFRVERTARIQAPAEKIFPLIDDFHRWGTWSPYEKLDPEMKRTFGGSASGKGATYAWDSKGKAGAGRMEIAESSPSSKIAINLDFTSPMEGHNLAEFTLQPQGDATMVTWSMQGKSPYVAKLMGIFFNMDQMIGKDFEAGLANLKTATEK